MDLVVLGPGVVLVVLVVVMVVLGVVLVVRGVVLVVLAMLLMVLRAVLCSVGPGDGLGDWLWLGGL